MPDEIRNYQVKANDFLFSFSRKKIEDADIIKISPSRFNLIRDHRSVSAQVTEADDTGKKLKIEIEGVIFNIEIKDELDQVLEQMGFDSVTNKTIKEIKAPMPGLVLEIAVADGQDVNEGDRILILEAMKMENSIMIHTSAKIKRVNVAAGQAVEKGQVLVELE